MHQAWLSRIGFITGGWPMLNAKAGALRWWLSPGAHLPFAVIARFICCSRASNGESSPVFCQGAMGGFTDARYWCPAGASRRPGHQPLQPPADFVLILRAGRPGMELAGCILMSGTTHN